jgi:DNA-directed RNA polymerase subunit omega
VQFTLACADAVRSDVAQPVQRLACHLTESSYVSGKHLLAEGITNPPIDELLTKSDSKYKLVLFAAKRARQINAYYSQLGEGLLDHVGPLVETTVQEKPLSIALREVNEGKLACIDVDAEAPADEDPESPFETA